MEDIVGGKYLSQNSQHGRVASWQHIFFWHSSNPYLAEVRRTQHLSKVDRLKEIQLNQAGLSAQLFLELEAVAWESWESK